MRLLTKKYTHDMKNEFYYDVNGEKIFSKLQAHKKAQSLCQTTDPNELWGYVNFIAPVDIIGSEPAKSLDDFAIEKIKKLRKEFEYIRLWASGGADSSKLIEYFKEANIAPDEIAFYNNYTDEVTVLGQFDIEFSLMPNLEVYKKWWPNTKIKCYEVFLEDLEWYTDNNALEHYLSHKVLTPAGVGIPQIYEIHESLLEQDLKTKSINLYAGPDIRIGKDNSGWYYRFLDLNTNLAMISPYIDYFYASNILPELTLKLAYEAQKAISRTKRDSENQVINGEWKVNISDISELTNTPVIRNQFIQKHHKQFSFGSAAFDMGSLSKSLLLNQNFLKSPRGGKILMKNLAYFNELEEKFPNWFNDNTITKGWIGCLSKKVYFTE